MVGAPGLLKFFMWGRSQDKVEGVQSEAVGPARRKDMRAQRAQLCPTEHKTFRTSECFQYPSCGTGCPALHTRTPDTLIFVMHQGFPALRSVEVQLPREPRIKWGEEPWAKMGEPTHAHGTGIWGQACGNRPHGTGNRLHGDRKR